MYTWINFIYGILRWLFVAGSHVAITCEVNNAVGSVLADILKNVGSLCLCSIISVWITFAIWHSYLFSDIKYMYSDMGVDLEHMNVHMNVHMYIHAYICILIHPSIHTYTLMYVLLDIYLNVYTHIYMLAHIHIYTHLYMPINIHSLMCLYIYTSNTCIPSSMSSYIDTYKHM